MIILRYQKSFLKMLHIIIMQYCSLLCFSACVKVDCYILFFQITHFTPLLSNDNQWQTVLQEGQYLVKARLFLHVIYSSFLFFVPLLLQPTPDTVFCRMWWPGEDGQEARSLQKLPEAGVRSVAQEQVFGYLHVWRMNINMLPYHSWNSGSLSLPPQSNSKMFRKWRIECI